mmetsp:Transcript_691/g.2502  ORF Transcript_691/g.2502 Transcript_691/m.2502 type:complete len:217 (-) Transcript_691:323-973(-)
MLLSSGAIALKSGSGDVGSPNVGSRRSITSRRSLWCQVKRPTIAPRNCAVSLFIYFSYVTKPERFELLSLSKISSVQLSCALSRALSCATSSSVIKNAVKFARIVKSACPRASPRWVKLQSQQLCAACRRSASDAATEAHNSDSAALSYGNPIFKSSTVLPISFAEQDDELCQQRPLRLAEERPRINVRVALRGECRGFCKGSPLAVRFQHKHRAW